ncbi:MAG: filamentous hemagglutinin N-terminal domain-containing protein [Pantoea ananatis]|uniref:hemagglutinin repeat-containing protein n=1 Tax=Pantoea TaxID=53335 RepID=UPI000E23170E|nr:MULTISPECIES: hemagglutinin repeat-containing protein [Pantoea]MCS4494078.1 hemagglutinin repeat-containing protein [Pantoea sp. B623]NEK81566.1 filamentous hemagglutinin N-terminal domain-containing protein [Pantoea ananatis]REF11119.1 filamentous hemagglutinin [Pantoea ananatis]
MNKHCYRLIFSRTHGELRVVSELARSCSNEPGQTRGTGAARVWVTLRRSGWLISLMLFNGQALADGIVADGNAAAGLRPEVINTQNGLPQVNITAPNQAGVSHNQYSQFDVDQKGAILNNSAVMTSTQMAGMIQGNPNINPNGAAARVILNEVNSNNPSQLRGYMEVAGGRAQVIVANPSGIVCNGCGTINAGRMTLTTGKPQLNADGSIAGYQVERGVVRIEGGGLNGDSRHDTEYVDVLARAVEVNAGVWAKEKINVVAGKNTVSADGNTVTPSSGQDGAKPELAIDMGDMGGMYSGQIRMIGTEAGVGVRNQGGQLQAGKTLTVSSEGRLVWQSGKQEAVTQAGESVTLIAKDNIEHAGKLHSGGTLNVQSRTGEIKQSGTMAAAGDVQLTAASGIENSGHLLAGSDVNSMLNREADLSLSSQETVRSTGSLLSKKNVTLSGKRVDLSEGQLAAKQTTVTAQKEGVGLNKTRVDSQNLHISSTGDVDARQAEIKAGNWDVNADNLFNQQAVWSQTGTGDNRFTLQNQLDNTGGTIEAQRLNLNVGALTNQNGRLVALDGSDQQWHVTGLIDNRAGELGSNGNMALSTGSLTNLGGSVKSMLSLQVDAKHALDNSEGRLLAGNNVTLQAETLVNHAGVLNGEAVKITAQQLDNAQGQILSQQGLALDAQQSLDNDQGLIAAGQNADVHTEGSWNNQGGTVQSETQLKLSAGHLNNTQGKLLSGDLLVLKASGEVNNAAGEISGSALTLGVQNLSNDKGKVIGGRSVILDAKNGLDNAQGLLAAGQMLNLSTEGMLNNLNGGISAADLDLTAGQLDNTQGKIIADNGLHVRAQQALDNTLGLLEAGETLDASTQGNWKNQQGTAQGGKAVIAATHDFDNTNGRLQSGGALRLDSAGDVINQGGKLTAQKDLTWQGATTSLFNNDGGSLQSGNNLSVTGGRLTNRAQGIVLGQDALSFDLAADVNNQDGQITGGGQTVLRAGSLTNAGGKINSLGGLEMQFSGQLDNSNGRIFSQLSQKLTAGNIANEQGWMGSQGEWRATTGHFANTLGSVQSEQSAWLNAAALNNQQGLLQAAAALTMRVTQGIDNRAGKISAQTQLDARGDDNGASTGAINNAGGQWLAGEALNLAAQMLDNTQNGLLYSQKQLHLLLDDTLSNQQGKVQSGENLTLAARSLQNDAGSIASQQQLTLNLTGELSNQGGALRSNGVQQVSASHINNQQGTISSLDDLGVTAAQLDNAAGTLISQGTGIYRIDTLNNQQGKIHSGRGLTLNGNVVSNQGGQLVSTQDMIITAAQITNASRGTISSQGALDVQGSTLDNHDGGLILGTTRTGISANELNNSTGRLQSAGAMTLAGLSLLDNRQGSIVANGPLNINNGSNARFARLAFSAPSLALLNQNGVVQSGATMAVNARTLDNQGGKLQSQQDFTLGVQQDYVQRASDILTSNGTLTMSVAGMFTNLNDWLLPGNLNLTSAHFTNPGTLVSKIMQITTGQFTNRGRVEADTMTLNVDTLDNPTAVMGDNITVNARIIDNYGAGGVIAATQSLNLRGNERLTNRDGALLFSSGNMQLGSNDLIENRASAIEASGDLTVNAQRLINQRIGLNIAPDAESESYKWHRYNYYWRSYGMWVNNDKNTLAPTTQQLTFGNGAEAQNNRYGTLMAIDEAGKRAQVRVKDNTGQLIDLWVNYLALRPNGDGSYAMTFYETRGENQLAVIPTPYQNGFHWEHDRTQVLTWDPNKHIDIFTAPNVNDYNNLRERTVTGSLTRDRLISEGTGARMLAGGNMALHVGSQLLNDASVITANGNLGIDGGGSVDNRGYSVNEHRIETLVDHYDRDESHWYPTSHYDGTTALQTIDGIISGNGRVSIIGTSISNTTVNQAQISSVEAALKAVDAERAEWERNPLAFSVNGASGQDADTQLQPGGQIAAEQPSLPGRPLLPAELAFTARQHLASVATNIPNNGLFRQFTASGSPYLVVTDARFTSRTQFISSDYLLSRVGYDPAAVHKRLGDGFYEQKLVRDQVLSLTGRQSVHGEDAMAQYQALMNNGVKVAQDFRLVPGVALTPEQIASLQQDIVWLVSETVNTENGPQTVWVPKVYLAQSTLRLTGDGALIAGGDLQLSANSVTNAGNLLADKALSIDASAFSHQSGDIKADSINVHADSLSMSTNLQDALRQASMSAGDISLSGNDIRLQGAKLSATDNLALSARDNLEISAAKQSYKANVEVISGAMGNRSSAGMEEAGQRMAQVSGEWQLAQGSELKAGGNLVMKAGKDITLQGSQAQAGGQTALQAGGNIRLLADKTTNSTHVEANSRTSSVSNSREEDQLYLSTLGGDKGVTIIAGKDLLAEGAQIDSKAGAIGIGAENVTIKEVRSSTHAYDNEQSSNKNHTRIEETSKEDVIGSTLSAQHGITTIARTGDITVTGSTLHSEEGAIALQAKHDITLNSATERESRYLDESSQKKGFLSKKSSHTVQDDRVTREKGTLISGNSVTIDAGNDLTVSGSAIAADQNVDLQAGNNVDISAATETGYHYLLEEKKKSGLMGSGGIGFTVGKQSTRHEVNEDEIVQSQSFSTIGSSQGNVNITAGNKLHIGGADLIAGKDLNLSGDSVDIDSGFDRNNRTETFESKQSGFTLALSGTVGSALNTAVSVAQQARKEGDGRLRALQGTKAALSGAQAAAAYENDSALTEAANAKNAAAGIDPKADNAAQGAKNTVGITLSYGSQSSKSESHSQSSQAQGSTLNAGRNIAITATGKNKGEQSGDITLAGTQMKAGGEMTLDAARDINLLSSQNTQQTDNKNSSKGGSVGIGIGVGSGGYGITVSASVNSSKGRENGNSLTHNETTLDAGGGINLKSGRDTTLKGAQVNGETIKADVGRNLTLASEQDSDRYDSKQQSASAGGSFTFGSMTGSANVNVSKDKIHSNFDSVKEQTGLFAGKGGYQITVGNHTQLDGAVIASTADKDRNVLDTGTLGWRDIQNQADYKSEHQSAGFNSGGPIGSNLLSNVSALPISAAGGSGHAEGSTKAAVSDGNIIIRNRDAQQQDLSGLSRDTEHANDGSISPIFDKEKEQRRLQQAQLVNDVATQALDVYNTHEAARATRAATASLADTDTRTALEAQASAMLDKAHEKDPNVDNSRQAVVSKAWQLAYDQAIVRQGADMGGSVRTGVNAVVNALQALAGGDIRAALAQGAAPYLAAKVKELTTGNAPYGELTDTQKLNNLMAHALLGGVVAELSGGSAAAGATGAVTGELATPAIALALYGTADSDKLSPEQKANLSALATLASGIAAGVSSGSTAGAATGALAGKNAVENNFLHVDEAERKAVLERREKAGTITPDQRQELSGINQTNKARDQAIHDVCTQGNKGGAACGALVSQAQSALDKYGDNVTYSLIYKDLYPQDAANLENVLKGLDAGSISRDQAITAIAKQSGQSWDKVAEQYDSAMQAQAIAVALAGMKGIQIRQPANVSKSPTAKADKNLSYVDEPPFNPGGTAGGAQPWSTKGRIKYVELPTRGKIRFVPDSNYSSSNPLPRGPNNGYLDKFGNEWVKGPSRTAGQAFEWDVQLSPKGRAQLGWATRDGSHLNVSLDGKITHK